MPKRFHLGWFVNFTPGAWDSTFSHGGSPWDGKFYVEFALALERACFDYIMLEDTLMVSEAYRGTAEATLKYALQVPKHDPVPLAAIIAAATSKLGVVATMSTMAWPPFMLARVCTTIDHIAGGRFGWNIVTSGEDAAAQNFGLAKLPPREQRYAMADEYMEVVYRLFDAWEPDAVVKDRERGIYADWRKVHPIDFEGEYFRVRGPLNTAPSPQGRPTFVQAGGSSRGRAYVIMPQVARLALPGLTNIWVSVLKDTALVALAGLNEIVMRSRTASGATNEPFLFFMLAALFFIVFSAATLRGSAEVERRLNRGLARPDNDRRLLAGERT